MPGAPHAPRSAASLKPALFSGGLGIALVMGLGPASAADRSLEQAVREARLEGQIGTAILLNRQLDPFAISVDVEGETAILTGTVDAAVERELAEQLARNARGISRVDNRIAVDADAEPRPRARDGEGERAFEQAVEDATITAAVKSRLLWNDATDGLDIDVDTERGRVTLSGQAGNAAEKALATRLAQRTDGVRAVDNRIEVQAPVNPAGVGDDGHDGDAAAPLAAALPEVPASDAWITAKVKASLLMSPAVDGLQLEVDTQDGRVALGGRASSAAERDLAVEIAKDIKGVKGVDATGVRIEAGLADVDTDD